MKKFKLGLDIHGVIDHDPNFFKTLTEMLEGNDEIEVHVITGGTFKEEKENLEKWGIKYDHFFSISDYHRCIGTPITYDKDCHIYLDDELWDRTKGDYCKDYNISIMIDDTYRYGQYMPKTTHFYHYVRDVGKCVCMDINGAPINQCDGCPR